MKYLSAEQVLFIHSRIIDETGGSHGLRDLALLQSAVERPCSTFGSEDLYVSLFNKAAALMESLIKNHPFIDGNKRTAITAVGIFLQLNDYALEASQKALVDFAVSFTTKKVSFDRAVKWFKEHSAAI
jgi:death on curing protein